jgi:hypothetical protein
MPKDEARLRVAVGATRTEMVRVYADHTHQEALSSVME